MKSLNNWPFFFKRFGHKSIYSENHRIFNVNSSYWKIHFSDFHFMVYNAYGCFCFESSSTLFCFVFILISCDLNTAKLPTQSPSEHNVT